MTLYSSENGEYATVYISCENPGKAVSDTGRYRTGSLRCGCWACLSLLMERPNIFIIGYENVSYDEHWRTDKIADARSYVNSSSVYEDMYPAYLTAIAGCRSPMWCQKLVRQAGLCEGRGTP